VSRELNLSASFPASLSYRHRTSPHRLGETDFHEPSAFLPFRPLIRACFGCMFDSFERFDFFSSDSLRGNEITCVCSSAASFYCIYCFNLPVFFEQGLVKLEPLLPKKPFIYSCFYQIQTGRRYSYFYSSSLSWRFPCTFPLYGRVLCVSLLSVALFLLVAGTACQGELSEFSIPPGFRTRTISSLNIPSFVPPLPSMALDTLVLFVPVGQHF